MVRIKLRVKVLPQEQLSPSKLRLQPSADASVQSFLEIVNDPQNVTLGELADMVRARYRKLFKRDLEIKKLLDDQHDEDELDADLTVADVFIDLGRAINDGSDQRAAVRVVQKPSQGPPPRYMSVVQEWKASPRPPVPLFPGVALGRRTRDGFEAGEQEDLEKRQRRFIGDEDVDRLVSSIERDEVRENAWNSQRSQRTTGGLASQPGMRNTHPYNVEQARQPGYIHVHEIPDTPAGTAARSPARGIAIPSDEAYDTKSESPDGPDVHSIPPEYPLEALNGMREASFLPGLHAAAQDAATAVADVEAHDEGPTAQEDLSLPAAIEIPTVQSAPRRLSHTTSTTLPSSRSNSAGRLRQPFKPQRPTKAVTQAQTSALARQTTSRLHSLYHLDSVEQPSDVFDIPNDPESESAQESGQVSSSKRRKLTKAGSGRNAQSSHLEDFIPASKLHLEVHVPSPSRRDTEVASNDQDQARILEGRQQQNDTSSPRQPSIDLDGVEVISSQLEDEDEMDVDHQEAQMPEQADETQADEELQAQIHREEQEEDERERKRLDRNRKSRENKQRARERQMRQKEEEDRRNLEAVDSGILKGDGVKATISTTAGDKEVSPKKRRLARKTASQAEDLPLNDQAPSSKLDTVTQAPLTKTRKPRKTTKQSKRQSLADQATVTIPDSQPPEEEKPKASHASPKPSLINRDLFNDPDFLAKAKKPPVVKRGQSRGTSAQTITPVEQGSKGKKPLPLNRQLTLPSSQDDVAPGQDESPSLGREKPKNNVSKPPKQKVVDETPSSVLVGEKLSKSKKAKSQPPAVPNFSEREYSPILPPGFSREEYEKLMNVANSQEEDELLRQKYSAADVESASSKARQSMSLIRSLSPQKGSSKDSKSEQGKEVKSTTSSNALKVKATSKKQSRSTRGSALTMVPSDGETESRRKQSSAISSEDKLTNDQAEPKTNPTSEARFQTTIPNSKNQTKDTPVPDGSKKKTQTKLTDRITRDTKGKRKVDPHPIPLNSDPIVLSNADEYVHSVHSDPEDTEIHAGPSNRTLKFSRVDHDQTAKSETKPTANNSLTPRNPKKPPFGRGSSTGKPPDTSLQDAQRDRWRSKSKSTVPDQQSHTAAQALKDTHAQPSVPKAPMFAPSGLENDTIQLPDSNDERQMEAKTVKKMVQDTAEEDEDEEGEEAEEEDEVVVPAALPKTPTVLEIPESGATHVTSSTSPASGPDQSEDGGAESKKSRSTTASESRSGSASKSEDEDEEEAAQPGQKSASDSPGNQINESLSQAIESMSRAASQESTESEEESSSEAPPPPKTTSVSKTSFEAPVPSKPAAKSESAQESETESDSNEGESQSESESESMSDSESTSATSAKEAKPNGATPKAKPELVPNVAATKPSAAKHRPTFNQSSQSSHSIYRSNLAELKAQASGAGTPRGKPNGRSSKQPLRPTTLVDKLKELPSDVESTTSDDEDEDDDHSDSTSPGAKSKTIGHVKKNVRGGPLIPPQSSHPTPENSSQLARGNGAAVTPTKDKKSKFKYNKLLSTRHVG